MSLDRRRRVIRSAVTVTELATVLNLPVHYIVYWGSESASCSANVVQKSTGIAVASIAGVVAFTHF